MVHSTTKPCTISSADLHLRAHPCPDIRKRTMSFHNRALPVLFQPAVSTHAVCAIGLRPAPGPDYRTQKPDRRFLRYQCTRRAREAASGHTTPACALRFYGMQTAAFRLVPGKDRPIALLHTTEI